ncbi:MAG: mechanosensitive ion channel domain-containing protein [Saprospiraceae bacterium]
MDTPGLEFNMLRDLLKGFMDSIPNVIGALFILIIGWLIAKSIAKLLLRVLKSIGIDRVADKLNEIEIIHKANVNFVPSVVLSKIVYYLLLLIFATGATDVLGMEAVSNLMKNIVEFAPLLISAIFVFIIGALIAEFIKNIVLTTCKSLGIPAANLIANFVFYFIFISAIMISLDQAQIQTEFLRHNLTVIIAGGVFAFAIGYGLASRDLMANFLASFYSKGKVNLGDKVTINNTTGTIIAMDNSSIVLKAEDRKIIIPLSKLSSEKVEIHESI